MDKKENKEFVEINRSISKLLEILHMVTLPFSNPLVILTAFFQFITSIICSIVKIYEEEGPGTGVDVLMVYSKAFFDIMIKTISVVDIDVQTSQFKEAVEKIQTIVDEFNPKPKPKSFEGNIEP